MKAIIKEVGKPPKVVDIENTLEEMQKIVGGNIEVIRVRSNILMLCDEEGKLKNKPYNFDLGNDLIVGNVLFVNSKGEDFTSLDEIGIEAIMHFFSRTPYTT